MTYTDHQIHQITEEYNKVIMSLSDLQLTCLIEENGTQITQVKEFLKFGVGRRLGILRRTIVNIFEAFPLDQKQVLSIDAVADIQINLHSFIINLDGIFDNLAWAFVYQNNISSLFDKNPLNVGMFKGNFQKHLPIELHKFLNDSKLKEWHKDYHKKLRDSLVHRIPTYVPPSELSEEDIQRSSQLSREYTVHLKSKNYRECEKIHAEQISLGKPSFKFINTSISEPHFLHPQILSDAKTIMKFSTLYFENWKLK